MTKRGIVTLVLSAAGVCLLFGAYSLIVRDPLVVDQRGGALEPLPDAAVPKPSETLKVGPVSVPPGGGFDYTVYDEKTGRPTSRFRGEDWKPIGGAAEPTGQKNEVFVTKPQITMLLPSGMLAVVGADEGQLTVERLEKGRMRPKVGWLRGGASILIDRAKDADRRPVSERPEDRVAITMERLEFDLERGSLTTEYPVELKSSEFEISGTGLELIWNQAENRVETLTLERGDQLVLYGGGLFGGLAGTRGNAATQPVLSGGTTQPAVAAAAGNSPRGVAAPGQSKAGASAGRATGYECVLAGGVVGEHYRGDEQVGRMEAGELHLVFDIGGGGATRLLEHGERGAGAAASAPASAPASKPSDALRERLVVHWSGKLSLTPAATPAKPDKPRRRLEAVGGAVTLSSGEGTVRCGRLEYYDETQQVWLYAPPGGRVEFGMGQKLSGHATSVYIDSAHNVVKLLGEVDLQSKRDQAQGGRAMAIRCSQWAELLLDPAPRGEAKAAETALGFGRLQSATFLGDVCVNLADQTLVANRLETRFDRTAGDQSLEAALSSAVALGDVKLGAEKDALECGRMELTFARTDAGDVYPRRLDAVGSVSITQDQARLRGSSVVAELDPVPRTPPSGAARRGAGENVGRGNAENGGPTFALRVLDITGRAELSDPRNAVAASGDKIHAVFEPENRLTQAVVTGTPQHLALVYARPYSVRGAVIDVNRAAQSLHVDGRARLSFKTTRGLRGEERREPVPVVVTSRDTLDIDGQRNTVHFAGNVVARTGDEELRGDTLTLLLEDVKEPAKPARVETPLSRLNDEIQPLLPRSLGLGAAAGFETADALVPLWPQRGRAPAQRRFEIAGASEAERVRKEPVRLNASNAVVLTETYAPGDPLPLVHSSIRAPSLEVDIVHRIVHTSGQTRLLLTNRQLDQGGGGAASPGQQEALGIPSALMTRGPSQTAMQCDGSMTYALGTDGPQRMDAVVFEGGVRFVHVAGREMVDFDQILPGAADNPEIMARLKNRNTSLECDRLECQLVAAASDKPERAGQARGTAGGGTAVPLRLELLIANGNVYLRDKQDEGIRTVYAERLEFDRAQGLVSVRGSPTAEARVFFENPQTSRFDQPAVGPEIVIDLIANTVRAKSIQGELNRPRQQPAPPPRPNKPRPAADTETNSEGKPKK